MGEANLALFNALSSFPLTGSHLFLQTDPIPGGSANNYDYCNADPINCYDLAGTWPHWLKKLVKAVLKANARGIADSRVGFATGFITGAASGCVAAIWAAGVGCIAGAVIGAANGAATGLVSGYLFGITASAINYRGPEMGF
jgi:hypothetical protein